MTMTSLTQIFYNTAILQAAGSAHCENSFHITRSAFALGAKADLTPEYSLANDPFGKVIGWLNILVFYKRPKVFFMFKNITTFAAQFAVKKRTGTEQRFHTLFKFGHSALKSFPLQSSVANPFPHFQYFFRQFMKLKAYFTKFAVGFTDCLKITFQMGPAYLANEFIKIIGIITITYKLPKKAAYQFAGRFLAAIRMNHKKCCCCTTKRPQPAFFQIAARPTGFVSMGNFLLTNMFNGIITRFFDTVGYFRFAITQTAETHWHIEHFINNSQRLAFAGVEQACQNAYIGQNAGAENISSNIIRQRSVNQFPAFFTPANMLNMFDHYRFYCRYIHCLVPQWLFVTFFKVLAAANVLDGGELTETDVKITKVVKEESLPEDMALFNSFISVPLINNGEVIGILTTANTKEDAFQPDDVKLLYQLGLESAGAFDRIGR